MKLFIITLFCITLTKVSSAQKELLSFDEHNKYIYYQVVDMPGFPVDTLHLRGLAFIKKVLPKMKVKSASVDNTIGGEAKFLIYNGVAVVKHETGEITYTMNIEIKDQKYRYWLTNFVFTPYTRDRYDNFVPQLGVEVPLETATSKFDKKDVESYLNQTGTFCKTVGDKLKLYMVNAPKKDESIKKVVTDKW